MRPLIELLKYAYISNTGEDQWGIYAQRFDGKFYPESPALFRRLDSDVMDDYELFAPCPDVLTMRANNDFGFYPR
jgi:hypothetical protein